MASVHRAAAALLLAAAVLLGAPAARAADAGPASSASPTASASPSPSPSGSVSPSPSAVPTPAPTHRQLARTGGGDATADGVLLSLGSVLLLTGAAFVVLCRRRPGNGR
ncbi:hypothetical protein [Kitasatospora phosalacinea]|uniref:Gram-positive cocci surface proteins LPxTG domain-containing protein n=1 Tax=Kitasatospora phosalacinea TaxID=2065 RepID=A0A9W6PFD5_9ACTN|nr:hypothetical protein [Kitasatospora phosalacinea]GLW54969.1 hypothetical protein Kpho01_29800 [Kitasatospora phosalacinea]